MAFRRGSWRVQGASVGFQESFSPSLVPLRLHGANYGNKNTSWVFFFFAVYGVMFEQCLVELGSVIDHASLNPGTYIPFNILWNCSKGFIMVQSGLRHVLGRQVRKPFSEKKTATSYIQKTIIVVICSYTFLCVVVCSFIFP